MHQPRAALPTRPAPTCMKDGYRRATCSEVPCPTCGGQAPQARGAGGHGRAASHIAELSRHVDPRQRKTFLPDARADAKSSGSSRDQILKEINSRLGFLVDVGLDYLTLSPQRGHALRRRGAAHPPGHADRLLRWSGVLYILDEPSIGLHQRDNDQLLATLRAPARPGQHADRRRARRGHDARSRLHRGHRPGRGRARRRRWSRPGTPEEVMANPRLA